MTTSDVTTTRGGVIISSLNGPYFAYDDNMDTTEVTSAEEGPDNKQESKAKRKKKGKDDNSYEFKREWYRHTTSKHYVAMEPVSDSNCSKDSGVVVGEDTFQTDLPNGYA